MKLIDLFMNYLMSSYYHIRTTVVTYSIKRMWYNIKKQNILMIYFIIIIKKYTYKIFVVVLFLKSLRGII